MANKIQAWAAYGPKIELANPMTKEEIIENIVAATNQSKGSVLAVLSELDVQTEAGLKPAGGYAICGRIIRFN